MKINSTTLVTPLGRVVLQDKYVEGSDLTKEEFNEMLDEWAGLLTKTIYFKCPSQNNKFYVFPGELLRSSYLEMNLEGENNEG